jgi:hypothetical protein
MFTPPSEHTGLAASWQPGREHEIIQASFTAPCSGPWGNTPR